MRGSQLRLDVGEEGHEAGALDGESDLALFARGDTGLSLRKHLCVRVRELLQIRHIFIVDVLLDLDLFSESLVRHD